MKNNSFTLLCGLTLVVTACVNFPEPMAPKVRAEAELASVHDQSIVVYTNFGAGMTFDANPFHGWGINGFLGPGIGQSVISQRFTPASTVTFSTASVALAYFSGPTAIRVFLQSDDLGKPGNVIEQISLNLIGSIPRVYTVSSTLSPVLYRGTPYWLTVAAGGNGVVAGWNWNSTGDISSFTFASNQAGGPSGPWGISSGLTRSAFEITGLALPQRGAILHQASGGGTVIWVNGQKVTYGINARQFADGSVQGELLFQEHGTLGHVKGTVTCLTIVGNRAYLTGNITQAPPALNFPHFAIGLEDNGEGVKATGPDRISSLILLPQGWPSCYQSFPVTDWTHGNAQVR